MQRLQRGISGRIPRIYGSYVRETPLDFRSYVWNMFDFGCAARSEGGVTGRNNKGLVTMDRKIKRIVFIYTRRTGIRNRWFISVINGIRFALGKIPKSVCIQIRKE